MKTTPPFVSQAPTLKAIEKWARHKQFEQIFNLSPENLLAFLLAQANGDYIRAMFLAESMEPDAQTLFSERLYEASTILNGRPTHKPFRSKDTESLSKHFGLEPEMLCETIRRVAREAHITPESAAIAFRSLAGEMVTWAFKEAQELIKLQDTRPAA